MNLHFIPLEEKHLSLIWKWLHEPHVKKFWSEPEKEEDFRAKYLGKKSKNIHGYTVELDEKPIGYIQHYEAWNVGPGWWPESKPGTYGLDNLIGDPSLIGRGIGTEMVSKFIHEILIPMRRETCPVKEIYADPDPANLGAIRSYEKVGFSKFGMVPTPYGESLLLIYKKT